MKSLRDVILLSRWSLPRVLILILAGGFAGLMVDIRVEHVEAVREHGIAWLPIIYSGFMTIACSAAAVYWNRITRLIMMLPFFLALVIGGTGFYLHNHGNLKAVIKTSISAWTDPTMDHSDEPPQFAPLAFAGLGMLGILASLKRFNPETAAMPINERVSHNAGISGESTGVRMLHGHS